MFFPIVYHRSSALFILSIFDSFKASVCCVHFLLSVVRSRHVYVRAALSVALTNVCVCVWCDMVRPRNCLQLWSKIIFIKDL